MKREPWQGNEAAVFVAELCELLLTVNRGFGFRLRPEYAATAQRNFSLVGLRELKQQGFLSKGLSRAGICDFQHQKRIEKELLGLEQAAGGRRLLQSSSEPVLKAQRSLQVHVRKPGPPIRPQRNALLVCRGDAKIRWGSGKSRVSSLKPL